MSHASVMIQLPPQLPALRATQQKLGAKAKNRDAIAALREELDKQEGRLRRLKFKNGTWRGNNNPALQFTKTFGQQAHDRKASTFRCNVYDQAGYPGLGNGRPDCVVVTGKGACMIYEFKPRHWVGESPLPRYKAAVERYYSNAMRRGEPPAPHLGGAAFQALVETNCREDYSKDKKEDTLKFGTDFEYYDRCAQKYECPQ